MAKYKKHQERAKTRPHHDILSDLIKAGIEVKDCTAPSGTVPQILARYRDVVWWIVVHRSEPDLVWDVDMIGNLAVTPINVTIVADAASAVRKITNRQCLSWAQKRALAGLLLTGQETFTQQEVAEALR